jgi:hypothetical protein
VSTILRVGSRLTPRSPFTQFMLSLPPDVTRSSPIVGQNAAGRPLCQIPGRIPTRARSSLCGTARCEVLVVEFAFFRDNIAADHEFAEQGWRSIDRRRSSSALAPGAELRSTDEADTWQTGIARLPLDRLPSQPLWPQALATWLSTREADPDRYLGNMN